MSKVGIKDSILSMMNHPELKKIVDQWNVEYVDRRTSDSLRNALSESQLITSRHLLGILPESDVKQICAEIGISSNERKGALVEKIFLLEFQESIPCPAICGFNMPGKLRDGLSTLKQLNMCDLYFYLEEEIDNKDISAVINTDNQWYKALDSYRLFYGALEKSNRDGRACSEKISWIIPENMLDENGYIAGCHIDNEQILKCLFDMRLSNAIGFQEWLPWISLGIVGQLRTWRSNRIRLIHNAIFKFVKYTDRNSHAVMPWEPNFNSNIGRMPMQVLYQFSKSNLLKDTLDMLSSTFGLSSINDLRCIHPNAVKLAKSPKKSLIKLHSNLKILNAD